MDSADPIETDALHERARRKSGRVTKKPQDIYNSSPAGAGAKRKHSDVAGDEEGDLENDDEDAEEEDTDEEPGDTDFKGRQRSATKGPKKPASKPATKRAKPNGVSLAIRPAAGKPKRPKKAKQLADANIEEAGVLYREIFANGENMEDVAGSWLSRFQEHEANAVTEIVNFVLKCAGCDLKVNAHDIEDPDNCANRLTEVQEEFQAQEITDYPIIAKGKGSQSFKQAVASFFHTLVVALAKSNTLFESVELIENIQIWISTMSSANNRPFRHTATVISLAVVSALCEIGKTLSESNAMTTQQLESEKKKARVNKERVATMTKKLKEGTQRQEILENLMKDWFDTVFIHRYRDVDAKIRIDCVQGLADWIMTYPEVFFDGAHLRYLGWVLSDVSAPTRLEVIRQLQRLFRDKEKHGGLKTFTERFRPRMVEMATQDADVTVRAAAVELLDTLREAGFLEPDDIDVVGRLIFDVDLRVRKAVVSFFAQNIDDLYEMKISDMGGQEALEEALATPSDDENYDAPRPEWLKLKCLAETLQSYDAADANDDDDANIGNDATQLVAGAGESRFSLATQVLYDKVPEVEQWEILAGYILYDHSSQAQNGASDDAEVAFKQECKLGERDDIILLDVLNAAVAVRLTRLAEQQKDSRLKKAEKEVLMTDQESAARHLATLIPRLLSKFGASPAAATAVLRMEHVLNLDVFQELRQDSATFGALLDDIKQQFLTHGNAGVLLEASRALLHARNQEDLSEITETKLHALWQDTVDSLHSLKSKRDLTMRGTLTINILTLLSSTLQRISHLSKVSNPVEYFEAPPTAVNNTKRSKKATQPASGDDTDAIAILISILNRGLPSEHDTDPEVGVQEDTLVVLAAQSLLTYFMWKLVYFRGLIEASSPIPDVELDAIADRRDKFDDACRQTLNSKNVSDILKIEIAKTTCEMYTSFSALRNVKTGKQSASEAGAEEDDTYTALILDIPPPIQALLLQAFGVAEKTFAKLTRRNLEAADDDDPLDLDDDEDDDPETQTFDDDQEKLRATILAERRLCELTGALIRTVLACVVDKTVMIKRLNRNKARLGKNYADCVAYLDIGRIGKKPGSKGAAAAAKKNSGALKTAAKGKKIAKSKEMVDVDVADEMEDEDPIEDEDERLIEEDQQRAEGNGDEEMGDAAEDGERERESVLGD